MTKEEYYEALKSPQWIEKRDKIKKRDGYTCVKCKSKKYLQVHHTYYLKDKMPWQVPDDCLITLCGSCHKKEHEGRPISSFYRNKPPKNKIKPVKKKVKPKTPRKERREQNKKLKAKNKIKENIVKVNKTRTWNLIAIKSDTLNKVYRQSDNWEDVVKSVNGVAKGFDNKDLAEHWLRQGKAGKAKRN